MMLMMMMMANKCFLVVAYAPMVAVAIGAVKLTYVVRQMA
jgi:hypothetical protein